MLGISSPRTVCRYNILYDDQYMTEEAIGRTVPACLVAASAEQNMKYPSHLVPLIPAKSNDRSKFRFASCA